MTLFVINGPDNIEKAYKYALDHGVSEEATSLDPDENCIILEESESIDQRINYWRGPESEFFIFLSNGMANNSKDVVYQ